MKVTCMSCGDISDINACDIPPRANLATMVCEPCFTRMVDSARVMFAGGRDPEDGDSCECESCQLRRAVEELPDSEKLIFQEWGEA